VRNELPSTTIDHIRRNAPDNKITNPSQKTATVLPPGNQNFENPLSIPDEVRAMIMAKKLI
jgi:hypothetical protein